MGLFDWTITGGSHGGGLQRSAAQAAAAAVNDRFGATAAPGRDTVVHRQHRQPRDKHGRKRIPLEEQLRRGKTHKAKMGNDLLLKAAMGDFDSFGKKHLVKM
eukprot:TRINITY_DN22846_c0_g1_i1.p2 TRINITY_DN22846_c0_g1~~TRINITY_DN22846_c0_g1_i1.p2  ORF type:complete len:102 (+),score=29.54 TRINITY_DN22846_c0_g1_i1:58-363(+)